MKDFKKPQNIVIIILSLIILILFIMLITKEEPIQDSTPNKTDYTIKYSGYSFDVPLTLQHEIHEGKLILSNKVDEWYAIIEVIDKDYETILKQRDFLETSLNEIDLETKNTQEKTYAGTTYLTLELTNPQKGLLAFSNLSGTNSAMLTITSDDNKIKHNVLKELSEVIKDATYYGDSITKITNIFDQTEIQKRVVNLK